MYVHVPLLSNLFQISSTSQQSVTMTILKVTP